MPELPKCEQCEGRGTVESTATQGGGTMVYPCHVCRGRGTRIIGLDDIYLQLVKMNERLDLIYESTSSS